MNKRLNFILFITDQHRADSLGCYGHRIVKTPNIDAMAERGVAFDKYFVASPVCMPNRASLMNCRMQSSQWRPDEWYFLVSTQCDVCRPIEEGWLQNGPDRKKETGKPLMARRQPKSHPTPGLTIAEPMVSFSKLFAMIGTIRSTKTEEPDI